MTVLRKTDGVAPREATAAVSGRAPLSLAGLSEPSTGSVQALVTHGAYPGSPRCHRVIGHTLGFAIQDPTRDGGQPQAQLEGDWPRPCQTIAKPHGLDDATRTPGRAFSPGPCETLDPPPEDESGGACRVPNTMTVPGRKHVYAPPRHGTQGPKNRGGVIAW
jgi:hypothetical protein